MRINRWLVLLAGISPVTDIAAQRSSARAEFVASSGYLWRGVTRHRTPVAQLFVSVGRSGKLVDLELATWASGVTGSCGRPACTEGTAPRVADVNASLQARFNLGDTRVALGANAYHFRPPPYQADGASSSTWEAVASVYAIASRHIQLGMTAWMDLLAVDGLYAEATGTLPGTLHKARPPRMFFTATVGFNQGQKSATRQGPVAGYFAKNGFTHASIEVSHLLLRPNNQGYGTTLQLFIRAQGNFDAATKTPVWPFRRAGVQQQVILGLAWHPIWAHGYRGADER